MDAIGRYRSGAAAGVLASIEYAAPPTLLAAPVQLAAETLAVAAVELKLVAELHELAGEPARGSLVDRASTYLMSWTRQRAIDPTQPNSGLAAALSLQQHAPQAKCLVLENHPIFGGEAKRNEFMVDGHRLMAPQGSDHFDTPQPGSPMAAFYESIGVDAGKFAYQSWESSSPEIPMSSNGFR